MECVRKFAQVKYDIKYHLTWSTKYRKPALLGKDAVKIRDIIRETCKQLNVEVLNGKIGKDYVHIFVSAPPNLSISKLMQHIKGRSAYKMFLESENIKKIFEGRHLWARGYLALTEGNFPDIQCLKK